ARVPLAGILLVAEMTGAFSLLAPAMIAVSVSSLLVGKHTLYRSQLETRADAPAYRLQYTVPAATFTVRQAMTALLVQLDAEQTIAEAGTRLAAQNISGAPVLDGQGRLLGILTQTDIVRNVREKGARQPVGEAMQRKILVLHPDETLEKALDAFTTHHVNWAPVSETKGMTGDQEVVGVVSIADMVRLSHKASRQDALHVREEVEETIPEERKKRANDPAEHAHIA
ncbi:MAG: CBS domain-containing protein, partial [Ktedonobacteraceae bacterium]